MALVLCIGASACTRDTRSQPTSESNAGADVKSGSAQQGLEAGPGPGPPSGDWFIDATSASGLDFVHDNGMTGHFYFPENMAPGVGLFDYDNDGDLDVYFPQGVRLGPGAGAVAPGGGQGDRLFRNDLTMQPDGSRTLHFTDVTVTAGIISRGYGMGVAAGDIDNDGWVDLYVTRFGPNQLFRNNGNGTFTDITAQSSTGDPSWSVSAAFFDYDRDGRLDLYVGNYLRYTIETDHACSSPGGVRDYCPPAAYPAAPDRLYHNEGHGRFRDVTSKSGLAGAYGPALGVTTADFDGDGWIDLYVANDGAENQLWINRRDGTFENRALLSGVALDVNGKAKASMGVDAGDADNDGDEDLFMTTLTAEGMNFFVNDGTGRFDDRSTASGLAPATLPYTGFGAAWIDADNDGLLDILSVNGTIIAIESQLRARDPFPRRQPRRLYRNLGGGRFEDISDRAGSVFASVDAGRGAAFGDIDNDGDIDLVTGNAAGPARLLLNAVGQRAHWIGLRLVGMPVGAPRVRDMPGARVELVRDGLPTLVRRARADGSYASANDPRVLAGLGSSRVVPRVRVRWPDGAVEEWRSVPVDRWSTLVQGMPQ